MLTHLVCFLPSTGFQQGPTHFVCQSQVILSPCTIQYSCLQFFLALKTLLSSVSPCSSFHLYLLGVLFPLFVNWRVPICDLYVAAQVYRDFPSISLHYVYVLYPVFLPACHITCSHCCYYAPLPGSESYPLHLRIPSQQDGLA